MPRILPIIILENSPHKHLPLPEEEAQTGMAPLFRTWLKNIPHSFYPVHQEKAAELFISLVQVAPDVFCIIGNAERNLFYALEADNDNRMRLVPLPFTESILHVLDTVSLPQKFSLSVRETEVLAHIAEGLLYKEVAEQLGISLDTVKKHLKSIYAKLQVQNRTQAVLKYMGYFPQNKTTKYLQI